MTQEAEQPALIPAEQIIQCEAWQMPVLEAEGEPISLAGRQKRHVQRGTAPVDPFAGPMTASKAEGIRAQAQEEGQAQGYQAGYQAGLQQAETEVKQLKAQLNQLMGQLMHPLLEQQEDLEQALLQLAVNLARGVMAQLPPLDEAALLAVVRQALAALPQGSENIRVMVHPRDARLLHECARQHNESWQIVEDPSLVSGGCRIDTRHSYVDFSLDKRLQQLLDTLLAAQPITTSAADADG